MPFLSAVADAVDRLNEWTGRLVRWLALAMLLVQLGTVLLRYVFGTSYIALQESAVYLHAALFMLGAGYTSLHDGHVRVDILYGSAGPHRKAMIDLFGAVFLVIPTMATIFLVTWPFVRQSWLILEGPMSVGGIPAVFLLKALVPLFCILLGLQGLSLAVRSLLFLLQPDRRP